MTGWLASALVLAVLGLALVGFVFVLRANRATYARRDAPSLHVDRRFPPFETAADLNARASADLEARGGRLVVEVALRPACWWCQPQGLALGADGSVPICAAHLRRPNEELLDALFRPVRLVQGGS